MDSLTDRVAFAILRAVAALMLFAGISLLVAAALVAGVLTESESALARAVARLVLEIAIVFVAAGAVSRFLSRPGRFALPNERLRSREGSQSGGGWLLIVLAGALVALPSSLIVVVRPFLNEWVWLAGILRTSGFLENM